MLHKPINAITEADLQSLVTEGRREDTQLEFKLTLPGLTDDQKKEFLKDVCAMANSQGGDLIYGIREDRSNPEDAGKAAEVVGIRGVSADATKLWMWELLNSSIEERLIGVALREIPLSSGGFAFVLRVPRSWNAPHVVRHGNHWRFYARNSAGVYLMNVTDLRAGFLLSETISQRLIEFREKRLAEIIEERMIFSPPADWSNPTDDARVETERKSLLVIHLQPFDSIKPGTVLNVAECLEFGSDKLRLCSDYEGTPRLNFDGLMVKKYDDLLQIYRNGVTEELDFEALSPLFDGRQRIREYIDATQLDRALFKSLGRRLNLLKSLNVVSPVLVSVALIDVKGCKLMLRQPVYVGGQPASIRFVPSPHAIDRYNLFLTGLIVENLSDLPLEGFRETNLGQDDESFYAVQSLLRPYCDIIWNAVGLPRSQYFDASGKWQGEVIRE